eukprot:gb/GFBE01031821.1/.p1 GENE.gb/GFBE01031821.1/~~gb/GFBE01031821.1/.p1  ORF type:complete len:339 (+),score=41.56 gb/GFBE01031821.1/:1-1017(+)
MLRHPPHAPWHHRAHPAWQVMPGREIVFRFMLGLPRWLARLARYHLGTLWGSLVIIAAWVVIGVLIIVFLLLVIPGMKTLSFWLVIVALALLLRWKLNAMLNLIDLAYDWGEQAIQHFGFWTGLRIILSVGFLIGIVVLLLIFFLITLMGLVFEMPSHSWTPPGMDAGKYELMHLLVDGGPKNPDRPSEVLQVAGQSLSDAMALFGGNVEAYRYAVRKAQEFHERIEDAQQGWQEQVMELKTQIYGSEVRKRKDEYDKIHEAQEQVHREQQRFISRILFNWSMVVLVLLFAGVFVYQPDTCVAILASIWSWFCFCVVASQAFRVIILATCILTLLKLI